MLIYLVDLSKDKIGSIFMEACIFHISCQCNTCIEYSNMDNSCQVSM